MKPATRPARTRRLPAAALALASVAGAGSCSRDEAAPTAPAAPPVFTGIDWTNQPLALSAERHALQLEAADLSDDPALPPCDPILVPRAGKDLTTWLWFAWEGDELVGRSRPPHNSTLVMRLRRVRSSILGIEVTGTVIGHAADEDDSARGRLDLTFNVQDEARVEGMVTPRVAGPTPRLSGRLRGHFSFLDSTRAMSLCTTIFFFLEVRPPGRPALLPSAPSARSGAAF